MTIQQRSTAYRWDEVRRELAIRFGLLAAGACWLWLFVELGSRNLDVILVSLLLVAGLAFAIVPLAAQARPTLSSLGQIALAVGTVWIATEALGYRVAAVLMVVPLLLTVSYLAHRIAIPLAAAIIALALSVSPEPLVLSRGTLALALAATAAVALLQVTAFRSAMWDAWHAADDVLDLARAVRIRQEEVNRLNKALRVSNGLLKRSLNELALVQREADEARHLKEQFATTVSHELRTPLNIILGFVEVMQRYPEVYAGAVWTPALRRDVAEIQRSARYLSELIDDVLDLARLQALKMPIRRTRVDLAAVIQEACDVAGRLVVAKPRVSILSETPHQLPLVLVDRTRIRQVLLNLLANACRFTEQGVIRVRASVEGADLVISVSDTGSGIPPDELERVFEEFRQVEGEAGTGQPSGGKGLGLAIAKRFVHAHGGRIWAESEFGRGSAFHFSIPLEAKHVSYLPAPPPGSLAADGSLPAIVVVDEPAGQAFLARHLEGFRVIGAGDLAEARRIVQAEHPHAVIVGVPPESEEARQGTPPPILTEPVPLLQCSLPASRSHREAGLFDDWMVKPIDGEGLAQALGRCPDLRSLLIVDDDHSFVRLVRRMLEAQKADFAVSWAHSGQEALERLRSEPVDVVLLDIALPDLSGHSVAQAIRRETDGDAGPRIVALTATRPGSDGRGSEARTFSVTTGMGLSEEETLDLIRACLARLRPAYAPELPLSGMPEAENETPVC